MRYTLIPLRVAEVPIVACRRHCNTAHPHGSLGYRTLVGTQMHYAVHDRKGWPLAMLGFSTAAWKFAPRDTFIGWTPQLREKNLPLVVDNPMFLDRGPRRDATLAPAKATCRPRVADHRRTRLRSSLEDRRRALVRTYQVVNELGRCAAGVPLNSGHAIILSELAAIMPREFKERPIFAIANPNKGWVVAELDKLRKEWADWLAVARELPVSPDYDPNVGSEAVMDGFDNLRKQDTLREKTLVFIGNNFSGYAFLFENWPSHPHEDVTSRLANRIPSWMHRLETLAASIEYARVPDSYWKEKGKELVDQVVKTTPKKAIDIAASYLKNPMGD